MQEIQKPTSLFADIVRGPRLGLNDRAADQRLRTLRTIVAFLGIGFLLRLAGAVWQPINLDEGSYLLEAELLLSGQVPFRDYIAREPIFIFLVAVFRSLFGPGYLAGRLLAVVAGTATSGLLYLLGARLYSRRAGLIAMAIHAVTPFFVYGGSILKLEPVAVAVSTAAMLAAASATSSTQSSPVLAGILIGLGVHVRRNMIVLLPVVALLAFFRSGRKRSAAIACLGAGIAAVLLPLGLMVALTTPEWVWNIYGRVFQDQQPIQSRLAVYRTALLLLTPQIPLTLALLVAGLRRFLGAREMNFAWGIVILLLGSLLGIGSASWGFGFGILWMPTWQLIGGAAGLGLTLALLATEASRAATLPQSPKWHESDGIVRLWFLAIAAFYVAFIHIFVDYYMDFAAVVSLASARTWLWIRKAQRRNTFINTTASNLVLPVLILSLFLPWLYLLPKVNPFNWPVSANLPEYSLNERTYPPILVRRVVEAIRYACPPGGSVLTGDPIFAVAARRRVFHNVTYAMLYFQDRPRPFDYDPYNLAPSADVLAIEAFTHNVPCVVVGQRTREWFRWSPPLQRLLAIQYAPFASFGEPGSLSHVRLYVRKRFVLDADIRDQARTGLEAIRGAWKFSSSSIGVENGGGDRAVAVFPVHVGAGIRVSTRIRVIGEGGVVVGYRGPRDYYGVRLIDSPEITGLNVFAVSPQGERSLADVPFRTFKNRPVRVTVFAFPQLLQVSVDDKHFITIHVAIDSRGRVGLLGNYGAWFSDVRLFKDPVSLLSR